MTRLEALLQEGTALAVVGMAGRFPGAPNVRRFWHNVREGVESIRRLTHEELRERGVPPELLDDPAYVRAAAVLEGMDHFDAGFFGFSPRDASILDPQHRHFLEVAWEALEDAGHPPERFPGPIGVFAGSGTNAYFWANLMTNPELVRDVGFFLLRHTGNDKDFLATRVSYELNLTGPSVNVQTACSTSLVAVHMAAQSLLLGECDLALAGGVTIEQPHGIGYLYQEREILSPDGHCRPFDASAGGTVFGSACGIVALRRLGDAVRDGDRIRAVLLGSAINNDGSLKVGYLAPSVDGQAGAIAEAIGAAGVDAATIGYVEAHGTGTAVGDPIEVAALSQAFGTGATPSRCVLGSVKSNIGHADTAAGVAGLIKAVSALEARELPPTLHFRAPNPAIGLEETPFEVRSELRAWEGEGPRRAGVSSLGVGGTNAFAVLEEGPRLISDPPPRRLHLLPLSGRTERVREVAGADLAAHLEAGPVTPSELADTAWTLSVGRRAFPLRRAVVVGSGEEAVEALLGGDPERVVSGRALDAPPDVAFLFAGGGAQHPGMAAGLHADEPVYRAVIDQGIALLDDELRAPVRRLLLGEAGGSTAEGPHPDAPEAERPSCALPALFLAQLAQARLWSSWGIRPGALIGHSMGEYTAACLAGVFSLADALRIVTARGRLFESLPPGGMLAVPLSEPALLERLPEGVSVAAVNGPDLTVASGPADRISALEERLRDEGIEGRRIRISVAAHSSMLEPILEPFARAVAEVELRPPELPFASNLTGDWITAAEATDPAYWVRHLRETVRFADGVRRLVADRPRILLEVGPGHTLATLARTGLRREDAPAVLASMRHPGEEGDDLRVQLSTLARLWTLGVEPDWTAFFGEGRRLRRPLPTYPFEHQRYWVEPGNAVPLRLSGAEARAPVPGATADGTPTAPQAAPASAPPADPIERWFWEHAWEPAPLPDAAPTSTAGGPNGDAPPADEEGDPLLLVTPASGGPTEGPFADELTSALGRLGIAALSVPAGRLASELERLRDSERSPAGVVHLGLVGDDLPAAPEPGSRAEDEAMDRAFRTPLALLQALGAEAFEHPLPFLVPAVGLEGVRADDPLIPWKSLVLGPVRTAPREIPGLHARAIDLPPEVARDPRRLAVLLAGELRDPSATPLVAHREGERLRQVVRRLPTPAPTSVLPVDPAEAWLITGGLGGLGLTFARGLLESGVRHLLLLSRSGLPPRHRWDTWLRSRPPSDRAVRGIRAVRALEELGATVELLPVDVTDEDGLRALLAARPAGSPPVGGVVHAAGVLDDEPLLARSTDRAERVLAPKVRGTIALRRALAGEPVRIEVLCSSRSAISGVPGQIDYTAANAFLDAWARHSAADPDRRTVAVEWDAWRETGMAHELQRTPPMPASPPAGTPDGATGTPRYLDHPLFLERREGGDGEVFYLAHLREGVHWMLDEHRLEGGPPLIPGAGFLEILRAALELETGSPLLSLRDVLFLEPFLVPPASARELAVRLRPHAPDPDGEASDGGGFEVAVLGREARGSRPGRWTTHVTGQTSPVSPAPAPAPAARLAEPGPERTGPAGRGLELGPRWTNLAGLYRDGDQAELVLSLPEAYRDDLAAHPLHPALLDVATAGAQELIPGFDAGQAFYIPASYTRFTLYASLPAELRSHVHYRGEALDGMAAFDVVITDLAGTIVAEAEEFVMIRVADEAGLGEARAASDDATRPNAPATSALPEPSSAAAPDEPPLPPLPEGIDTAGGLEALERILAHPELPPVLAVVPRDLVGLLAELDRATPAARAPGSGGSMEDPPEVQTLVDALLAHPAVTDAAAVAHPWGAGELRVVAFVQYDAQARPTVSELRRHVRDRTPDGLVPQSVVELTEIPRDPRGRLDRSRVHDPLAPRDDHQPPRTRTERLLAGIWTRLLGLDRVGLHDNFLDVGGHSLVGIRVLLQVERETGVRLHPNALTLQTLEQLAAEIDRQGAEGGAEHGARTPGGPGDKPSDAEDPAGGLARRFLSAVSRTVTRPSR